jgi:hypothetical protein
MMTQISIPKESAMGIYRLKLGFAGLKGCSWRRFEYCLSKKRANKVPMAKSALRRAIVFLRDQMASKALLIKIIKALKIEKERFEPIGFI